ncbi:hypothetical protein BBJ28_00013520 [Nothophytophthora sp. Chile5]|nr:hypothetical protein BBJ28_00013520 [Nothophytophthora sp. Chile5]
MTKNAVPATFKAVEYEAFGNALEVLKLNPEAVAKPLQPTQVRIKVFTAAVNPIDYLMIQIGESFVKKSPSAGNPFRMGFDVAGVIAEVGSGDVEGFQVGDEVYGMPGVPDVTYNGTFAEFVNVDVKFLARKPTNMSFAEAAGVPLVGETSYQSLVVYGKLQAGQRVLILGGGSACGMFGIQIAKALGAEVITTCSGRNTELVKSLGADQAINYTQEKWGDVLAAHSIDLIYDCAMEPEAWNADAQKILKKTTGIFVSIAVKDGAKVESPIGATLHHVYAETRSEYLKALTKLIEAGKLKTVIDSVHSLENVKDAIKVQMTRRAQGKIIVEVAKA